MIVTPPILTAQDWCDFYGVETADGVAVVYKGVNEDYSSPRGTSYAPGTRPVASDWDGGKAECGGGLHFSPSPGHTLSFHANAKRFLACPILLSEVVIHKNAASPEKIKVSGCCAPVYEVDISGNRISSDASNLKGSAA